MIVGVHCFGSKGTRQKAGHLRAYRILTTLARLPNQGRCMIPLWNAEAAARSAAAAPPHEGGSVAILIFTGLNALGVVFLLYVLVQFWKEGCRSTKPGTGDRAIKFSLKNRPTVIVVTHPISGELHVLPEALSVKVEPAPVSRSAHAGLSVVSGQARMGGPQDRQHRRESADGAANRSLKSFSTW